MLVDMIKVYNKYSELNVKCDSCDSLDHSVLKCDLINYKPFPTKIIQQYQKNSFQIRKQFTRLRKRKFQVLKNKTHLERNFTKFRDFQENVLAEYHFKYLENESELDYSSSDSESLIYLDNLNGDLGIL